MALSPQSIREQQFKSARRGYDPDEVDTFRTEVADALESAQNEAAAMEARARAAVARLQELSKAHPAEGDAPAAPSAVPTVDEAETISRTLLLAQRTADTTVAEARAEADRVLVQARDEAAARLAQAEDDATTIVDAAKEDARRAGEGERVRVEGEVQALLARRDFLESDVDHLEQFLAAQRERITEAVSELGAIVQRVPNGLADMRRPLLSAAADDDEPGDPDEGELGAITSVAEADDDEEPPGGVDETGDVWAARDTGSDATTHEGETLLRADERA
jgi:DivIVA domain-containing protein